jgi:hypothetical protein
MLKNIIGISEKIEISVLFCWLAFNLVKKINKKLKMITIECNFHE